MQQQQAGPMFPVMPSLPPNSITTEQIQKYLDENKKLILAILDNQNLGKLAECAQYQAQLQKNLMYLAAIADAQPQTPAAPPPQMQQMAHHPSMQQGGGFYMMAQQQQQQQHPHAMAQQPNIFPPRPRTFQDPQHLAGQSQPHVLMPIRPTTGNDRMNRGGLTEHIHGGGASNYINGNKKQENQNHDGGQGSSVAGDKEEAAK